MLPSLVLIAIHFILSFLLTSDGSRQKKHWLPPEIRFPSSTDGFPYPALLPADAAELALHLSPIF